METVNSLPRTPSPQPHYSPETCPEELRRRNQWVVFRRIHNPEKDRIDKVPFQAAFSNRRASTTDPSTWSTFEHALRTFELNPTLDGIGYVFAPDDPYCGIDFDDCVNESGEIDPWVITWKRRLGGYLEYSPSGRGVHAIVKAVLSGKGRKRTIEGHKVEVYDRGRFFTVTGAALREGAVPEDAQEAVDDLYHQLIPLPKEEQGARWLRAPILDDEQVLEKARRAKSGRKFKRLYDRGDTSGYPSHSEADSALAYMLIFWTAGDREQIVRLFEQSALYRPKEKHAKYLEMTVDGALASYTGTVYDPEGNRPEIREKLQPLMALLDAPIWTDRKAPAAHALLTALINEAMEHGVPDQEGVLIGVDLRTLSIRAGVTDGTLRRSSLPYLSEMGVVRFRSKGKGATASRYLLRDLRNSHISYPHGTTNVLGSSERAELARMRTGRSRHALTTRVGKPATMLLSRFLSVAGGTRSVRELVELTGRSDRSVRGGLGRLLAAGMIAETGKGTYRLRDDFWSVWGEELLASGIIKSENLQKQLHEDQRRAQRFWMSGEAPAAGDVPPDPEDERLRQAGWEPLRVGQEKLWRHPRAMYLGLVSREEVLAYVDGQEPEPCIHHVPGDPSMSHPDGCWMCRRERQAVGR